MDVISDTSPRKSSGGSIPCEDLTSSCPCIDNYDNYNCTVFVQSSEIDENQIPATSSCPTVVTTPLLVMISSTGDDGTYDGGDIVDESMRNDGVGDRLLGGTIQK